MYRCIDILEKSISSRKQSFIIRWTLSTKISLFSSKIFPFSVQTENPDKAAHFKTDPLPCLSVGRRQSRSLTCECVLQTCTRPVVGKDDSSDHLTVFHLSIEQIL
ncbi:hypothetical protein TNCV_1999921 [Trichonephila clavipes]|nr:hypothetical protein TNCV_1999921 [Trichonephila clavipes]